MVHKRPAHGSEGSRIEPVCCSPPLSLYCNLLTLLCQRGSFSPAARLLSETQSIDLIKTRSAPTSKRQRRSKSLLRPSLTFTEEDRLDHIGGEKKKCEKTLQQHYINSISSYLKPGMGFLPRRYGAGTQTNSELNSDFRTCTSPELNLHHPPPPRSNHTYGGYVSSGVTTRAPLISHLSFKMPELYARTRFY